MFDFEEKLKPEAVAEQQYEAATYAEVLSADTEAIACGTAMLIPFSTDMVSDADKEMLHNSFAEAFGMDTEGIVDDIKDGAKKFWAWLKKIWIKFKKAMSDLYKKIKGFLGFKEKEIDEAIREYSNASDAEKMLTEAKFVKKSVNKCIEVLGGEESDGIKTVNKKLDTLLLSAPEDIAENSEVSDKWMLAGKSEIDSIKDVFKTETELYKIHFNLTKEYFISFVNGTIKMPDKKLMDELPNKATAFTNTIGMKGIISIVVESIPGVRLPIVVAVIYLTSTGIKTYTVPKYKRTGWIITTDIYGEIEYEYKNYLKSRLTLIREIKEKTKIAEDLVASTDKLIKELDGSDKLEDKAAVKEAQTMATIAKQQTTAATKQVNNVIIVKNKRTKNPKYKNKKKKKS